MTFSSFVRHMTTMICGYWLLSEIVGAASSSSNAMVTAEQCPMPLSGTLALPVADEGQRNDWQSIVLMLFFAVQFVIGVVHSCLWVRSFFCSCRRQRVTRNATRHVKIQSMVTYTALRGVTTPRFEVTRFDGAESD